MIFLPPRTLRFAEMKLALCLALALSACSANTPSPLKSGEQISHLRFTTLDGAPRVLEEYRGKNLVIFFWATWCSHSATVMDRLIPLIPGYTRRGDTVFLAVSVDEYGKLDAIKERIERRGLGVFEHAYSGNAGDDEAFVTLHGSSLPYIVILGRHGEVLGVGNNEKIVKEVLE